jgi:hypothetical protein
MKSHQLGITYIGGPTCLLDVGGVRLLTDPAFDSAGGHYKSSSSALRKPVGPSTEWRKGKRAFSPIRCQGSIADSWRGGVAKALERQFAAFTPENVTKVRDGCTVAALATNGQVAKGENK